MQRYKRPSASRAFRLWIWKRKLPLAGLILAMACWSKLDRVVMRDELSGIESRLASASGKADSDGESQAPEPVTVRAVGSGGLVLDGRGILRVGESLDGWELTGLDRGTGHLRRGDVLARVRSGSVFDTATGAVTR
jgi:hypothetical protein